MGADIRGTPVFIGARSKLRGPTCVKDHVSLVCL